jgi:hypothetical protein
MLVEREDDDESTREWLLAALVHRPRSVADLAEELADASEEPVDRDRLKERLRKALGRMAREGLLQREGPGTGPNVRWSLRWEKAA